MRVLRSSLLRIPWFSRRPTSIRATCITCAVLDGRYVSTATTKVSSARSRKRMPFSGRLGIPNQIKFFDPFTEPYVGTSRNTYQSISFILYSCYYVNGEFRRKKNYSRLYNCSGPFSDFAREEGESHERKYFRDIERVKPDLTSDYPVPYSSRTVEKDLPHTRREFRSGEPPTVANDHVVKFGVIQYKKWLRLSVNRSMARNRAVTYSRLILEEFCKPEAIIYMEPKPTIFLTSCFDFQLELIRALHGLDCLLGSYDEAIKTVINSYPPHLRSHATLLDTSVGLLNSFRQDTWEQSKAGLAFSQDIMRSSSKHAPEKVNTESLKVGRAPVHWSHAASWACALFSLASRRRLLEETHQNFWKLVFYEIKHGTFDEFAIKHSSLRQKKEKMYLMSYLGEDTTLVHFLRQLSYSDCLKQLPEIYPFFHLLCLMFPTPKRPVESDIDSASTTSTPYWKQLTASNLQYLTLFDDLKAFASMKNLLTLDESIETTHLDELDAEEQKLMETVASESDISDDEGEPAF